MYSLEIVEVVDFVTRPEFYGKTTSKGTPMEQIADVRGQKLTMNAYQKKDLQYIYNETGVASYCPNIGIWDEDLFPLMCLGKEKWVGRNERIKRTIYAVEVFHR